ncbi:MAG: PucR family transcriptional regulator [Propionibacteriales bacterium]|nr:MAG: PucR family transcriptional regulator [Propionibacteriales bacterium]
MARALVPDDDLRNRLVSDLNAITGRVATATLKAMDCRHAWVGKLEAEPRSWIGVVARAGIDGFVTWFADADESAADSANVFVHAPRSLLRRVSLPQTVELIRTTIDTFEEQVRDSFTEPDRSTLMMAIMHYSREVAFAAAGVYARAAEVRGAWDARLESLVMDAVVRSDADDQVLSRASTLGWRNGMPVVVAVGEAKPDHDAGVDELRHRASREGLDALVAVHGERLIALVTGPQLSSIESAVEVLGNLTDSFGKGAIVVGPIVTDLSHAGQSAREALVGHRAAAGWPEAPNPVAAEDLLPERALLGDGHARQQLRDRVYQPLASATGDLLLTATTLLDCGTSVEAAARALIVHPNTVRYRIKRIHEVTGFSPQNAREAYVLRLGITLGQLRANRSPS